MVSLRLCESARYLVTDKQSSSETASPDIRDKSNWGGILFFVTLLVVLAFFWWLLIHSGGVSGHHG